MTNRADAALGEPARSPKSLAGTGGATGREGIAAVGGVFGAIAASSCCIVPLILFALGAGGAWVGNLTALYPYKPIFVGIALAFQGYGYYRVYRRPKAACAEGSACARPAPRRLVKLALFGATALVAIALAFPYLAPLFLGT